MLGLKEANQIAQDGHIPELLLPYQTNIPQAYDLTGLKLSAGSQKSFYRAIAAKRKRPERVKTKVMLDQTRYAAAHLAGNTPTDEEIWKSIRHPDITRMTRDFLWRCMHQAYKVGEHWRNIPTFEHFATCRHCDVDDSLEHILTVCEAPGQEILWNLAKELWETKGYAWPEISLGGIMACGFADVEDARGRRDPGANRLYRILVSETANLIWKTRCTRVIERGSDPAQYFSEAELRNKWRYCMNSRLKTDFILTDKLKFENRALNPKKVLGTWKGILKDPENLADPQLSQSRVLVGMAPLRPPGRNQ
ncbi:hypothetical protein C8R45DRAFT_837114 [Mycena sanguinolenta]|nr:hypothetical protein C8R45DRAFT_837114 [Mycena sanguinolenta]